MGCMDVYSSIAQATYLQTHTKASFLAHETCAYDGTKVRSLSDVFAGVDCYP